MKCYVNAVEIEPRSSGPFQAQQAQEPALRQQALASLIDLNNHAALVTVAQHLKQGPEVRRIIETVENPKTLARLARSELSVQLRIEAVKKIHDEQVLHEIAIRESNKSIAHAALDRVRKPELLDAVSKKAKTKSTRTIARQNIALLGDEDSAQQKRVHAEQIQLCQRVEDATNGHEWVESQRDVSTAEREWNALPEAPTELKNRFETALQQYHRRLARYAPAQPAAPARASQTSTPNTTPTIPERAPVAGPDAARPLPAPVPKANARSSVSAQHTAGKPAQSKKPDKPDPYARLEKITSELEQARATKKLKSAEKALKLATDLAQELNIAKVGGTNDPRIKRFQTERQAVFIHVQELQEADDWKRWANVPRCEELIKQARECLQTPDTANLSKTLQDLRNRWKQVGPIPHRKNKELWNQFRSACDDIFKRIKESRAQQSAQRVEHLKQKQALCEQAEQLAESTSWDQTARQLKALQAEWKRIGPVPRKQAQPLWDRFRSACDKFFERRGPHLQKQLAEQNENLQQKEKLCQAAERLGDSNDLELAKKEIRKLQTRWRRVGLVPRKNATTVNKRFKVACDAIFDKAKHAAAKELANKKEQFDRIHKTICELTTQLDAADCAQQTLAVRAELLRLSPTQQHKLLDDFNMLCQKIVDNTPDAFEQTELDLQKCRQRKLKVCTRLEKLAKDSAKDEATPASGSVADVLRAALANNTFRDFGASSQQQMADTLKDAQDAWARSGPVPGDEGRQLQVRFDAACEQLRTHIGT